MPTLKYGRASGRASQGWNNACSVSSRRAHCRSLREDAPQSKVTALEGQSASSVGDCAVIDDANQEQIAKAAALVLERAKAVLNEKLEDYESELQQLETAASRNFVYKGTNAWTMRLLRRKSEFVKARIRTMDELAANVYSCSLDRRCTFMLKTSADLEEMKRVVSSTLEETMSDGLTAQQTAARTFPDPKRLQTYNQQVEKDLGVSLPPVTWTEDDEARVLEDALWEAALVASKIEGASVQVERSYDCVARCERRDTKEEANFTNEVSAWANKALKMNISPDVIRDASQTAAANIALETAVMVISAVFFASITASFLVWLFGLSPSLDDTLHWKNMLPTDAAQAHTLFLWTLPLVSVYALLGGLRGYQNRRAPGGFVGSVTQASAFAADKLQSAGRVLQYASASSASDMRILYFLSTLESVCVGAPFLWGLLPGVVLKLGAPFGGILFKGATVPRVIQAPFIALGVAALCGTGNFFNSAAADMVNRDEKRDDTKYVDSLFQVQSPVGGVPGVGKTSISNGRIDMYSELGSDNASAERALNQYVTPATTNGSDSDTVSARQPSAGEVINDVSNDPPTSITMDFLSAASKRDFNSQQEWIQPTAVVASSFYLCLEAQLTGEIAYAAFTQIVAILVLDYMTRPWNRVSMAVRIVMDQGRSGRSLTGASKEDKGQEQ